MSKTIKSDLQWQAENDANTMMRYQEIVNDKARMNRAVKAAKQQAASLSKQASALQNVAKTKTKKK